MPCEETVKPWYTPPIKRNTQKFVKDEKDL